MATVHRLIDINPRYQRDVDFDKIEEAGIKGVYIKATEGTTFVARGIKDYQERARMQNLRTGFYHYLRPRSGRSGAREAEHFYRNVRGVRRGSGSRAQLLRLAVDVEETQVSIARTIEYTLQFTERLKDLADHEPVLYTFPRFIQNWGPRVGELPLWIAHYDVRRPGLPEPFDKYVMWQFTSQGRVPGIVGDVDVNKCPRLKALMLNRMEY